MKVQNRIRRVDGCEVIDLADDEKAIYTGCGWKLASFEEGRLIEFFDPQDLPYLDDWQAAADQAVRGAVAWMDGVSGEVWLVMCSGYQLCEPRCVQRGDAASLAHMARVIGRQAAESVDG